MTEPSLALQTAIRSRLLHTPEIIGLVEPPNIRDGDTRPSAFPSIILGDAQVVTAGHYGSYRNVTVYLDLHIWGENLEAAKTVGALVSKALFPALETPGFDMTDGLRTVRSLYMTDPSKCGHGIISLSGFMGYRL